MAYGGQILGTNEILFFFLKKKIILEIGKKFKLNLDVYNLFGFLVATVVSSILL